MPTSLISRNISIDRHRTSVRLEPEFWRALSHIAKRRHCTIHDLAAEAAAARGGSLTSAIRVLVLLWFMDRI